MHAVFLFSHWIHYLRKERIVMLWVIAGVLLVLWLVGMLAAYTLGGLVHLLLIAALVLIVVKIVQSIRRGTDQHHEPMK